MGAVPINRMRALITCTRPRDYLTRRLREAARYLLDRKDATEEERRMATEAIELLRAKRGEVRQDSDEPPAEPTPPPASRSAKADELGGFALVSCSPSPTIPHPPSRFLSRGSWSAESA